jgi:hypothetical protein
MEKVGAALFWVEFGEVLSQVCVKSCDREEVVILWWMHVWGAPQEL